MATQGRSILTPLERSAYLVLLQRRASAQRLARALGVSRSTAARVLAALRRKKIRVVSIREDSAWHYEIKDAAKRNRENWRRCRLRAMAGFAVLPSRG